MSKLIPIVDEQDRIVRYKPRPEVGPGEIYRVSALWLTNSHGDILLAQRGFNKSHNPGLWGPAVAGTVERGESYKDNILKEVTEEIGLFDIELKLGPKRRVSEEYNYFCQWYTAVIDKPAKDFIIEKQTLEQVRWFSCKELARELREHPEQYLDMSWALKEL